MHNWLWPIALQLKAHWSKMNSLFRIPSEEDIVPGSDHFTVGRDCLQNKSSSVHLWQAQKYFLGGEGWYVHWERAISCTRGSQQRQKNSDPIFSIGYSFRVKVKVGFKKSVFFHLLLGVHIHNVVESHLEAHLQIHNWYHDQICIWHICYSLVCATYRHHIFWLGCRENVVLLRDESLNLLTKQYLYLWVIFDQIFCQTKV